MASKNFSELVKSRRDKGVSITGSISYGIKERLKEKLDPRQMINQKGLLTALFPSLKSYKAGGNAGATLNSPEMTPAGMDSLSPMLEAINQNMMVIAKNSVVLPNIMRDVNVMQKNMAKLVKLKGGTPAMSADKRFFLSAKERNAAYKVQTGTTEQLTPTTESPEEKTFFEKLFGGILSGLTALGGAIAAAFGKLVAPISKLFNFKDLAGQILGKEAFKTLVGGLISGIVRPLLPYLIALAVAEYFKFNKFTESTDIKAMEESARNIPGFVTDTKGVKTFQEGKIENQNLPTSYYASTYKPDVIESVKSGDLKVVSLTVPGTNQRQFLPLADDEAEDLKSHYNNLAIAAKKIEELSNKKGGESYKELSDFMKLKSDSEKGIDLIWQKILKQRFKQPPEEVLGHIENRLKYPDLGHFSGKMRAMQDALTESITGKKQPTALDNQAPSTAPATVPPTTPSTGEKIETGTKELKTSSTSAGDQVPEIVVNNSETKREQKVSSTTIPSVYDFEAVNKFSQNNFMDFRTA